MKERDYFKLISEELRPDLAFVVGCRFILPQSVYTIPSLGTVAFHDSLLPRYRGFAPLNWSLLNGENQTGVTAFFIGEKFDAGDIIVQKPVEIGPDEPAPQVYERICQATVDLALEVDERIAKGNFSRTPQEDRQATFTCSRNPEDGLIDWRQSVRAVYNQIRALTFPYPGAYTYYRGKKLILWKAKPVADPPKYVGRIPGRVVGFSKREGWADILTSDGILRIVEVQTEDHEKTSAASVLYSVREKLGLEIPDLLERIRFLERALAEITQPQSYGS